MQFYYAVKIVLRGSQLSYLRSGVFEEALEMTEEFSGLPPGARQVQASPCLMTRFVLPSEDMQPYSYLIGECWYIFIILASRSRGEVSRTSELRLRLTFPVS